MRRTWDLYLASKEGQYAARAGTLSPYWSQSEQRTWPQYDLASIYLRDSSLVELLSIERVEAPQGAEYRITSRFRDLHQGAGAATWWTALTVTVYAVREGDRWVLVNALPRNTRDWRRDAVGPITYVIEPGYEYNRLRAQRALAFTDSLAIVFDIPRLAPLTYYLTSSVDKAYEIMGLESTIKYGPVGGVAQPVNRQLFSGIPAVGEEYRHELAHLVLAPLVGGRTTYLVSEGVATWLGGTRGLDFSTAARDLADFLAKRPQVSLDSVLAGSFSATETYPAAAIVVEMVFEAGGINAVKELFTAGPTNDELRAVLERQLNRSWTTIRTDWRRRALAYGRPPPS